MFSGCQLAFHGFKSLFDFSLKHFGLFELHHKQLSTLVSLGKLFRPLLVAKLVAIEVILLLLVIIDKLTDVVVVFI